VGDSVRRPKFFGSGLESSLTMSAGSFFSSAGNRQVVENALVAKAVGAANPDAATAVTNEVDALLQKIPTLNSSTNVQAATAWACTAVLGSAAVTLQ
jgi:hypothetical protein